MLEFLSPRLKEAVGHIDLSRLYELRVRADKPLLANLEGAFVPLGRCGPVRRAQDAVFPTAEEVEETLFAACGYSVHAVENELRQGFVTAQEGERVAFDLCLPAAQELNLNPSLLTGFLEARFGLPADGAAILRTALLKADKTAFQ